MIGKVRKTRDAFTGKLLSGLQIDLLLLIPIHPEFLVGLTRSCNFFLETAQDELSL